MRLKNLIFTSSIGGLGLLASLFTGDFSDLLDVSEPFSGHTQHEDEEQSECKFRLSVCTPPIKQEMVKGKLVPN